MTPAPTPAPETPRKPLTKRDSLDFRDLIYWPALVRLEEEFLPEVDYLSSLDQGREGA